MQQHGLFLFILGVSKMLWVILWHVIGQQATKNPLFMRVSWTSLDFIGLVLGGDEEDRTPGLGVANAALSQLSYIPNLQKFRATIYYSLPQCQELVGERKRDLLKKDNPVLQFNLDLTKPARFPYNRAHIGGPQF
jgi:hypothetical protein